MLRRSMNPLLRYILHCPKCEESTVLQHQHPSGTDEGLRYRPTGSDSLPFVCRTTLQWERCTPVAELEEFCESELRTLTLAPWMVVCKCAQCSYKVQHRILTISVADDAGGRAVGIVLKANVEIR